MVFLVQLRRLGLQTLNCLVFVGTVSKIDTHRLTYALLARNSASDGVAWEHDQCVHIVVVSHRIYSCGKHEAYTYFSQANDHGDYNLTKLGRRMGH